MGNHGFRIASFYVLSYQRDRSQDGPRAAETAVLTSDPSVAWINQLPLNVPFMDHRRVRKMLTIVQVITGLNTGGAERMMQKIVLGTDPRAFRHTVVSLTGSGVLGPELMEKGIRVIPLRLAFRKGLLGEWRRLGRACREADVVCGWMYHANLAALLLGMVFRKPVIFGIRRGRIDHKLDKATTRLVYKLGAWVSRHAQAVIYCSNESVGYHCRDGYCEKNIVFVPNGIDVQDFRRIPSEALEDTLPEGDVPATRVLLAGRWSPLKGHDVFLESLSRVAGRHTFQAILCGNDITDRNPQLMELIKAAGLSGNVALLGRRSDMPEIMSQCEILVSASSVEAFPNTIAEAMACECSVS